MMFIFKKKKIILHAFLCENDANYKEFSPISSIKEFVPEWWKKIPAGKFEYESMSSTRTVRSCVGIKNMMNTGFILPMWTDLGINISPSKSRFDVISADEKNWFLQHPDEQKGEFCSDYKVGKIISPWFLKCDLNINFFVCDPIYLKPNIRPFITFSGILDYKYQYGTNCLIGINKNKEMKYMFKVGDPLYQIIPLTENKVELKIEIADPATFSKLNTPQGNFFSNGYFRHRRLMEEVKEREQSKCPFGFGKK